MGVVAPGVLKVKTMAGPPKLYSFVTINRSIMEARSYSCSNEFNVIIWRQNNVKE